MFNFLFHKYHKAQQAFLDQAYGKPYSPKDTSDKHAFRLAFGRKISDTSAVLSFEADYIPLRTPSSTLSIHINN